MTIEELEINVIEWARERNILSQGTKRSQHLKTIEEVGELGLAIAMVDKIGAKDAIGDIMVTLVIQARMWGLSISECCESAWNEIKDRTGKIEDGMFVKDEK